MKITKSTMPLQIKGRLRNVLSASGVASLFIAALFLIPFSPLMPESGLDPSWRSALNEALTHGYVFGRDLVFTFGPLAPVYSTVFSPGTDTNMMVGSAVFSVGLCISFGLVAHPRRHLCALAVPFIIAISPARDSVFLGFPFLLLLIIVRTLLPRSSSFRLDSSPLVLAGISLATVAVSITPIVKGSFMAGMALCCALAFAALLSRCARAAVGFAILVVASMSIAWMLAGQPLSQLPHFFVAQGPIISGYTDAMSLPGPIQEPIAYLIASIALLITFYVGFVRTVGSYGWVVFMGLAFVLFISFKAGMVRQDGHVFISMGVLLILGYAVSLQVGPAAGASLWISVGLAWATIGAPVAQLNGAWFSQVIQQRLADTIYGVENRLRSSEDLTRSFVLANARIAADEPLPAITGTVDIYPVDLSPIFANRLKWAGRPVLQSYSAYEPSLDALNVAHLRSGKAPQTVLFTFSTIDGRLPSLDDSGSLVELLRSYEIVGYTSPFIRMTKRAGALTLQVTNGEPRRETATMGQEIKVDGAKPTWLKIDIQPTAVGRLLRAAYKLPQLEIDIRFEDGHTVVHRYVPAIGRSGFMVSPYLNVPQDLIQLAAGITQKPRVTSFKIVSAHSSLWKDSFDVQSNLLDFAVQPTARALILSESVAPIASVLTPLSDPAPTCFVDMVNGSRYSPGQSVHSFDNLLNLSGWTAPANAQHDDLRTWLVLTGADGTQKYYRAIAQQRPDVVNVTKNPLLHNAGFSAMLDLAGTSGKQVLSIISLSSGKAHVCPLKINVQ